MPATRRLTAVPLILVAGLVCGCARMDSALGQQWAVVQFNPNTSIVSAKHIVAACSHVPNMRPAKVATTSADPGIVDSARFDATNSTPANQADLQSCLQRFAAVQSVSLLDSSDMGN